MGKNVINAVCRYVKYQKLFQIPQLSASYYYLDDLQLQNLQIASDPVYMEVADDLSLAASSRSGKLSSKSIKPTHLTHEDSGFTEEGSDVTSSAGSRGNKREGLTNKRMK